MRGGRGRPGGYGTGWNFETYLLAGVTALASLALSPRGVLSASAADGLDLSDGVVDEAREPGPINPGGSPGGTCAKCHQWDSALSHPVGVKIASDRAKGLPLTDGQVTCLTCHDPEKADGHQALKARGQAFLRVEGDARALCARCHSSAVSQRVREHGMSLAKAHLQGKSAAPAQAGAGWLDAESASCTSCHDGTTAPDAGSHQSRWGDSDASREHPVGVKVKSRPATRSSEALRFVDTATMDKRIRLYDRAVGCGSCHSLYSGQDKLLVMSNNGSQLCLKCHVE